jgi:putative membrane protein
MWYMHEGMGWWMVFGGVWMIVFWGAIIGLIVWGISKLTRRDSDTTKSHPVEIAKERYARGEITREEYEQLKRDL